MKNYRNDAGFTLIEILLSISIMALLILPLFQLLRSGNNVQNQAITQANIQQNSEKILRQMITGSIGLGVRGLVEATKVAYDTNIGIAFLANGRMYTYYKKGTQIWLKDDIAPANPIAPTASTTGGLAVLDNVTQFLITTLGSAYKISITAGKVLYEGGSPGVTVVSVVYPRNFGK